MEKEKNPLASIYGYFAHQTKINEDNNNYIIHSKGMNYAGLVHITVKQLHLFDHELDTDLEPKAATSKCFGRRNIHVK